METPSSNAGRSSGRSVAVMLLVGTRKGAFIYRSDAARKKWRVEGPRCRVERPINKNFSHQDTKERKWEPRNSASLSWCLCVLVVRIGLAIKFFNNLTGQYCPVLT